MKAKSGNKRLTSIWSLGHIIIQLKTKSTCDTDIIPKEAG